jgi:hypothetical protein
MRMTTTNTMRRRPSSSTTSMVKLVLLLVAYRGAHASTSSSSSSSASSPHASTSSKSRRHHRSVVVSKDENSEDDYDILSAPPISFTQAASSQSLNKFLSTRWQKAVALAQLEQDVEDYNAAWIASASNPVQAISHRRLIAMPLLDEDGGTFDPPMGVFSHGHVQTGDKMSLPRNYWQSITLSKAQVPWLFSVSRIEGVTSPRVEIIPKPTKPTTPTTTAAKGKEKDGCNDDKAEEEFLLSEYKPFRPLDSLVGGGLDFRAPSNYVSETKMLYVH